MTDQEARDEREALIDAMINVEVSGGMVEFCAADREDAGYLADAVLAWMERNGYRKQPEPEWEYGVMGPTGRMVNNGDYRIEQTHQRTKPGPWIPVDTSDSDQ